MDPKPLFKTIIDTAAFLELSGDDIVDPDAAMKQLEDMAATLQELDHDSRDEFISYIEALVQTEKSAQSEPRRIEFLEQLAETFGLADQQ